MKTPQIVTPQEWEAAHQELLVKEKAATRARTRWRQSAAGCRGSRSRSPTRSTARRASSACSTCSRAAAS